MFPGLDCLHFDSLHYNIRDLANARHPYELPERQDVFLHLNGWYMGTGGDEPAELNRQRLEDRI